MPPIQTKTLDTEIIRLSAIICGSVGYVEEQIIQTTEGIIENNPLKINSIKSHPKNVRKLTLEATQKIIEIFVKHKPKSDYSKILLVSWRISIALERISALLTDAADYSHKLNFQNIANAKTAFINIQESLMSQTYDLVICYTTAKYELIPKIIAKEKHISSIYKGLFKDMLYQATQNQALLSDIEICLSIAKILEITGYYIHEIAENLNYQHNITNK